MTRMLKLHMPTTLYIPLAIRFFKTKKVQKLGIYKRVAAVFVDKKVSEAKVMHEISDSKVSPISDKTVIIPNAI